MTKKESEQIAIKRELAIIELLNSSRNWNKENYIQSDFTLDSIIRKHTNRPEKSVGKPPYDFIEV